MTCFPRESLASAGKLSADYYCKLTLFFSPSLLLPVYLQNVRQNSLVLKLKVHRAMSSFLVKGVRLGAVRDEKFHAELSIRDL